MKKVNSNVNHFDPILEGEREELLPAKETTQDMYTDDTIGDPEGAAARQEAQEQASFPDWVFNDYVLSTKTVWGKAWSDGKEHLVPKQTTIDSVINLHKAGEENYLQMVKMAHSTDAARIESLKNGYETVLADATGKDVFPVLKGIGNQVQVALAERAYRKHLYIAAADRVPADQPQPEYVENLQTNMFNAATDAGVWYDLHAHCWNYVQWKNSPVYYVDNEIKLRLVNAARYIDENYRSVKPVVAPTSEQVKLAIAC